jgi:hypothetical protein
VSKGEIVSGILTIHSIGYGEWLFGHSWVEFVSDQNGEVQTFGTWGNNPTGKGNGLFRNLELGRSSQESRSFHISDEQEAVFWKRIEEYSDMGAQAWTILAPCSSFVQDVWESTTGEKLSHQAVLISNPLTLKNSIAEANLRAPQSSTLQSINQEQDGVSREPSPRSNDRTFPDPQPPRPRKSWMKK